MVTIIGGDWVSKSIIISTGLDYKEILQWHGNAENLIGQQKFVWFVVVRFSGAKSGQTAGMK